MKRELEIEECEGILDLDQIGHLDFLILKPCYITRFQESEDVDERGIRPEIGELDIDEGNGVPERGCTCCAKKSRSGEIFMTTLVLRDLGGQPPKMEEDADMKRVAGAKC